jgi:hypothetical protein
VCVAKEPHLERRVAGYDAIGWDDARTGRLTDVCSWAARHATRMLTADEVWRQRGEAGVGGRDGSSRGKKRTKFAAYRRQPPTYSDAHSRASGLGSSSWRVWPFGYQVGDKLWGPRASPQWRR